MGASGRLAITDIVIEKQLATRITCNADLWAACISGAAQPDAYQRAITDGGFVLDRMRKNLYEFLFDSARAAAATYGVISVSFLARAR